MSIFEARSLGTRPTPDAAFYIPFLRHTASKSRVRIPPTWSIPSIKMIYAFVWRQFRSYLFREGFERKLHSRKRKRKTKVMQESIVRARRLDRSGVGFRKLNIRPGGFESVGRDAILRPTMNSMTISLDFLNKYANKLHSNRNYRITKDIARSSRSFREILDEFELKYFQYSPTRVIWCRNRRTSVVCCPLKCPDGTGHNLIEFCINYAKVLCFYS